MNMNLDDTGVKTLVCAIVQKAVDDWKLARKALKKRPDSISANYSLADCENFFNSEYFYTLTEMDGAELLKRLKEQEEKEEDSKPRGRKKGARKQKVGG